MKGKVLELLKQQPDYISGEEMSRQLGVTRASIWKVITKLKQEGYEIISSTKKGYKLIDIPNSVTPEEILPKLSSNIMGKVIHYEESVLSTNEVAKTLAREGAKEGTLVIAEQQTKGKGRLGRLWESPKGDGIWMSLVLRPKLLPQQVSQLTLVGGLAMCEAIKEVTGLECGIKWPNDIVVKGKKICGILTEMSAEIEQINYVILGVGVNVNTKSFSEDLPYATSLWTIAHKEYSRVEIITSFLRKFESYYNKYTAKKEFSVCLENYKNQCVTLNKKVNIHTSSGSYIAYVKDVTKSGELLIEKENGEEEIVFAGEVSVRGIYGYSDEEKE